MKNVFSFILTGVIIFGFFSCEKSDNPPVSTATSTSAYGQPTLTATIDGRPVAFVATLNMNTYGGLVQIIGAAPMTGITITIPVPTDTITYSAFGLNTGISVDSSSRRYNFDTAIGTPTIKITSYNSANAGFSGTFSCTLTSMGKHEVITNGVFSNF